MPRENDSKHSPYSAEQTPSAHRDPITGAPGSHPVGVGVGAAGGASAGAAIGAAAGPVGAVVGAAIGGVAGGLIGKGVAEVVNPTSEHAFWKQNYKHRPYYEEGYEYALYGPAYQYGWESYSRFTDKRFEDVELELKRAWDQCRSDRDLSWEQARPAACDAWQRAAENTRR